MKAKTIPKSEHRDFFLRFFPKKHVELAMHYWDKHPFHLKVTAGRKSKFGDFKVKKNRLQISINGDLPPFFFSMAYFHELAHLLVYLEHGHRIQPHGKEWQHQLRQLLEPLYKKKLWPREALPFMERYIRKPSAQISDPRFLKALGWQPNKDKGQGKPGLTLKELYGRGHQLFQFQDRQFKVLHLRRTRFLCEELGSGRYYTIHRHALVKRLDKTKTKESQI